MKKIIMTILVAVMIAAGVQATDVRACTGGCVPPPSACTPTDFTADLYTVTAGNGTVIHWDSIGCDEAAIHPAAYPGDRPPYGSIATGAIFYTTVFTLTVYDEYGDIGGQRFLTITVDEDEDDDDDDNGGNCRIDDFDADDTSIEEGDSTDLNWETTGCDEVKINQGIGEVNLDGSEEVDPNDTTTYTLTAYEDGDIADTDTVKITVNNDDDEDSCSIDSFKADDYSIEEGDSTVIRWTTTGADGVDLSPGYSNRSDDGSVSVSPSRTTTYELTAECQSGSDKTRTITISVDEEQSSRPQAVTTVATILSATSAQLNGLAIPNTTTGTTRAWFEWGPTGSLGYRTTSQSVPSNGSTTNYSAVVNGLVPGTAYFYRAAVENQNGTAYGDIVRFQTRTVTTTPPTTIVRTQVVRDVVVAQSAPSLLELRVESTYDRMCVAGEIDYTVTYRNISTQTLQDAVLQINHQKEVTFISATRGNYDVVDRTVTVDLGSLAPGETGTVLVHGRVNNLGIRGNLTVMTAQVVYTNPATNAQENAIAYSLVTISEDCPNVLGASVFGFGSFLPDTLLEWLFLILVILALVVLGRQLYKKKEQPAV